MKRNDIGYSCVLGLREWVLATRRVHPAQEDDHAPMPASTPHHRHRSARLDAQKGYAATPIIGNVRSLWFPFHSPCAMEAGQYGVERRRGEGVSFRREGTMLQCPAVEVRKGSGR